MFDGAVHEKAHGHSPDWWLFFTALTLLGFGLMMTLSSSAIMAERVYNSHYYFFSRQLIFACVGMVALFAAYKIPLSWIYRAHYPALGLVLLLLIITLTPLGSSVNGARRWLRVGPVSIQALEFAKVALALYLAYFFSNKQSMVKSIVNGLLPPYIITGLLALLLLVQPDFGGAAVLVFLLFFMCLIGGSRLKHLFFSALFASGGAVLLISTSEYRLRRFTAFLDPFEDPLRTGYQLVQSLCALGSGGLTGTGLGAGKQKLFFLPEAHTDFIMAVVGEELGFLGVTLVIALLAMFIWRGFRIALRQTELRERLLASGLTMIIGLGMVLNLAVVFAAAPPKGVPMPFLSYGGSNLVSTLFITGLLLNLSRYQKANVDKK